MSMSFLLSILTLTTVLALTVLLLFVLGKLLWLEKATKSLLSGKSLPPGAAPSSDADPYFYGLNDEALWRALTGEYESSLSELELDEIRPRSAMSLSKAIIRFIKEARPAGAPSISTRNSLDIFTTRGRVTVWLPPERAGELIELGSQLKASPPALSVEAARLRLSELFTAIYAEVNIERDPEIFGEIEVALFPQETVDSSSVAEPETDKKTQHVDAPS